MHVCQPDSYSYHGAGKSSMHVCGSRHGAGRSSMHVCGSRHGAGRSSMHVYDGRHGAGRSSMHVYGSLHGAGRSSMHVCGSRHGAGRSSMHAYNGCHGVERSSMHVYGSCHGGGRSLMHVYRPCFSGSHHGAERCSMLFCQPGSSLCYLERFSVCCVIWEEDQCLTDSSESLGASGLPPGMMQSRCAGGWPCAMHSAYSYLHSMAGTRYVDGSRLCADCLSHGRHCACGQ